MTMTSKHAPARLKGKKGSRSVGRRSSVKLDKTTRDAIIGLAKAFSRDPEPYGAALLRYVRAGSYT